MWMKFHFHWASMHVPLSTMSMVPWLLARFLQSLHSSWFLQYGSWISCVNDGRQQYSTTSEDVGMHRLN